MDLFVASCMSYDEKFLFSCGDDIYNMQWVTYKNRNINVYMCRRDAIICCTDR
ncbi:hypothetical protein PFDG_05353, partial [Plasmodium falciparum Dd2]